MQAPPRTSAISHGLDSVVALALAAMPFAFIPGLPWLDYGLWPQTEGPAPLIHFCAAVLCVAAGAQLWRGEDRYVAAALSPAVALLFAFSVLAGLLAPFSDEPTRSIHGTLKHGIGIIWNFEFAVTTFAAAAVWPLARIRVILAASCAAALAAVIATYLYPSAVGTPFAFPEWVGLLGAAVAGVLLLASRGRDCRASAALAALLVAGALYVSGNRALVLAAMAVAAFGLLHRVPALSSVYHRPAFRAIAAVIVIIAGAVAMFFAAPLIESRALEDPPPSEAVLANDPIDRVPLHEGALGTLWSRSHMIRILAEEFVDDPGAALVGNGFGYFATAYERHARDVPGRRFAGGPPTASRTYWDVHEKANFHSHNMLAETAASVGLAGTSLWLGSLAALAFGSPIGAMIAVGYGVLGTFWFPVNHMIGPMAILFGAGAAAATRPAAPRAARLAAGFAPALAILAAAVLFYAAVAGFALSRLERTERGFVPVEVNTDPATCGFIRTRLYPEQEIVIDLYTILQTRIARADDPKKELVGLTTNLLSINCMLRRYFTENGSIRALVASLEGRGAIVAMGPVSYGSMREEIIRWGDDLRLLLAMEPERTEYLSPYITTLAMRVPEKAIEEINSFEAVLPPEGPVVEYLRALRAKLEGDRAGYIDHLQAAVDLGYANLWPVSREIVEATGVR